MLQLLFGKEFTCTCICNSYVLLWNNHKRFKKNVRESQNILNSCIISVKFVPFPTYTVLSKGDSNTATIHDSNKNIVVEWSLRTYIYLEFQSAKKILFYCKLTVNPNCILPNWFTHCSDICFISIRFYWKCLLVRIYILIQNYVKVDQHHPPTSIAKFSLCVYK